MPLPRFRRGPSTRTPDDDDWGTSSPAAIMEQPSSHVAPLHIRQTRLERLKQQQLSSYTCTFSPRSVIGLYFTIALLFILIGSLIIVGTTQIEIQGPNKYYINNASNSNCATATVDDKKSVLIILNSTMKAPIYFYYRLTQFYQSAREYAKSRSDLMNQGIVPSAKIDLDTCLANSETGFGLFQQRDPSVAGKYEPQNYVYPCGIIAFSQFTDSFTLQRESDNSEIELKEEGIAWWTDRKHKFRPFKNSDSDVPSVALQGNAKLTSERFMNWMRLSAFPTFDKLYGIIEKDLKPGAYKVTYHSTFQMPCGGEKFFYLSTMKWFGGRNPFLGTAYLVVGVLALLIAILLLVKHVISPSPEDLKDPTVRLREYLADHNFLEDDEDY